MTVTGAGPVILRVGRPPWLYGSNDVGVLYFRGLMNDEPRGQVAWPKDAWRLRLRLSAPALDPPVVQYGIFSEDPRKGFSSDLKRVEQVFQQQLAEVADPSKRQALRGIQLAGAWSHLFRTLRGDQVYLLVSPCADLALMSNGPTGAKWLGTKPVQIGGRPWCRSVPFEAAPGQEIEIALTEDNLLDLEALEPAAQP